MNDDLEDCCPYCGANHLDGSCRVCGDRYCDECLEDGFCPNCDGRADEDARAP